MSCSISFKQGNLALVTYPKQSKQSVQLNTHTLTHRLFHPGSHWDNSHSYFHFVTNVEPVNISDYSPGLMRNLSVVHFHLIAGDEAETKAKLPVLYSTSVRFLSCKHPSLLKEQLDVKFSFSFVLQWTPTVAFILSVVRKKNEIPFKRESAYS